MLANLDGDDRADVIGVAGARAELTVYLDAEASQVSHFPLACRVRGITSGDFNGDRTTDVIVTMESCSNVQTMLLFGDGRGGFKHSVVPLGTIYYDLGSSIVAHDMDRDGRLDLLVAVRPDVAVIFGNGDGTLRYPPHIPTVDGATLTGTVDVNGDGVDELLLTGPRGKGTFLYWLRPDGRYEPERLDDRSCVSRTVLADITGDGTGEIVLAYPDEIRVVTRTGSGWSDTRFATSGYPQRVLVADITGDGVSEIVTVESVDSGGDCGPRHLRTYSSEGTLLFDRLAVPASPDTLCSSVHAIAADVNENGATDVILIVGAGVSSWVHSYEVRDAGAVLVYRSLGDGTFHITPLVTDANIDTSHHHVGDANADGHVDVMVGYYYSGSVSTFAGDGRGGFTHLIDAPIQLRPGLVMDFNLDGILDRLYGSTIEYGTQEGTPRRVKHMWDAFAWTPARYDPHQPPVLVRSNSQGELIILALTPDPVRRRNVRH